MTTQDTEQPASPGESSIHPAQATPAADAAADYVLGTDDAELRRLGFQHQLWSSVAHQLWLKAGFQPGQRIIDLGCGPGFASLDLAQLVGPAGSVLAIDASPRYLAHLKAISKPAGAATIETLQADAQRLPLDEACADGAFTRWVLSFAPEPERVVAGIAKALRPGAHWVVQDYADWPAIFWAPLNHTLPTLRAAVVRHYDSVHADYRIGQKLPAMMERAGMRVRHIQPIVEAVRPGNALWHWPMVFFRNLLPRVVAAGHLTERDMHAIFAEWEALELEPGAYYWTPPMVAIIAEKL